MHAPPVVSPPVAASVPFSALPGWREERVADAMPAFLVSCARLAVAPPDQVLGGRNPRAGQAGNWAGVCAAARAVPPADEAAARVFFESHFRLSALGGAGATGLFTGYYEPEIAGSREKTRRFSTPVLTRPADLAEQTDASGAHRFGRMEDGAFVPYYSRAEIDAGALRRQRLDLLYLASPVDLFFLQIQGSGRIDLPNGHVVRLGYDSGNGQPYVPIGRILSERGEIAPDQVSAQSIRTWLNTHPAEARGVMALNPSFTFFHEQKGLSPDTGPLGALGVQLMPMRSIAVDRTEIPLGAPVYIDTTNVDGSKLQRLMVAQDLGSALSGPVRADIFYGWGSDAEADAGRMAANGRAWLLLLVP